MYSNLHRDKNFIFIKSINNFIFDFIYIYICSKIKLHLFSKIVRSIKFTYLIKDKIVYTFDKNKIFITM